MVPAGDRPPAQPIPMTARTAAVLLGLAMEAAGVWAVFRSTNQVGTGVLLIIGAGLLLLGIQGTPLSRITHGESSVEFALLEQQAASIADRAIREQPPEVAVAVAEAVASMAPSSRLRHSAQTAYADAVLEAIERVGGSIERRWPARPGLHGVDARVRVGNGVVNVRIKSRMGTAIGLRDVQRAADQARDSGLDGGFLLVTNLPVLPGTDPSAAAAAETGSGVSVQWEGARDDDGLHAALHRNAV